MKRCTKCENEYPPAGFSSDRTRKDGLFPQCRECCKADKRQYYQRNRDLSIRKSQEWAERNRDRSREIKRRHAAKPESKERLRQYLEKNNESIRAKRKEWQKRLSPEQRAKKNQRDRERNAAHPERRAASVRKYEDANRERLNERSRRIYAANPEAHNKLVRDWELRNPEKKLSYIHARRARKEQNGGTYTDSEWEQVKTVYGHQCLRCRRQEPEIRLTVDHVIPIKRGGINSIDNIQPLCKKCNQSKGTKIIDYRKSYQPACG